MVDSFRKELALTENAVVFHPEHGALCVGIPIANGLLWHPIWFVTRDIALAWMREGSIEQLQRGLSSAAVGFTRDMFDTEY